MLEREARMQAWVAGHGYPAPAILELVPPGELFDSPVQVMERRPGSTMAAAMMAAPWHMLRQVRQLAACQAALHRLPVPPWADDGDWSIAQARRRLLRHVVPQDPPPGLAAGLKRAERLFPLLHAARPAICHGDFHPANLLTGSGQVAVIDWTDTGTGDRHADLART